MSDALVLDGRTLGLEDVERAATDLGVEVTLDEGARRRIAESRAFIEEKVASGERVYGVTTGFGRLAEVVIEPGERTELQHNLLRSHASGMGAPLGAHRGARHHALARERPGARQLGMPGDGGGAHPGHAQPRDPPAGAPLRLRRGEWRPGPPRARGPGDPG